MLLNGLPGHACPLLETELQCMEETKKQGQVLRVLRSCIPGLHLFQQTHLPRQTVTSRPEKLTRQEVGESEHLDYVRGLIGKGQFLCTGCFSP